MTVNSKGIKGWVLGPKHIKYMGKNTKHSVSVFGDVSSDFVSSAMKNALHQTKNIYTVK